MPTNATLKFDDTALYICTSGSIASEGRFAIEIYKCRLAKKTTPHKKEKLTTYYSIKKRYGQPLAVIISPATLLARGYN
jgi:LysM repeat protein